ncbi:MAG TPA: BTAD domain-containing putative transcriptional regulator [Acidimicrobiia bacterium]
MSTRFRVLGTLEAQREGPLDLGGPTQQTVLAVLLAHANRVVSADYLVEEVWGERTGSNPAHTLRVHISELRKTLEPNHRRGDDWSLLKTVGEGYRLEVDAVSIDAANAERLLDQGRAAVELGDLKTAFETLGSALGLWSGRPYGDLESTSVLAAERSRLSQLRLHIQELYFEVGLRLGHHDALVGPLQTAVTENPYDERLCAHLMVALYRAGRQVDALAAYKDFSEGIGEELGLEPGPELQVLEENVLLQDPSLALESEGRPTNLPTLPTSFVGREEEVATAIKLLDSARILTLTGTGGVGKTRMAVEVGVASIGRYRDGVWLIELAPLREAPLVALTVAHVLEIDPQPGRQVVDTISERLRDAEMLIILDNCEHLVEPSAQLVSAIVTACPGVTIMVTSRQPLAINGEAQLRVPGLPGNDATRLFAQRAVAHDASFGITPESSTTLQSICRHLDGIPLAIELAAVRVKVLGLEQIEAGLRDRFSLLTAGARSADPRQQTLEAAIDWSHDVLEPDEQRLFRRLAIFRGTFGFDALKNLYETFEEDPTGALDVLTGLVDKSLINTERSTDEVRYELLETVRQYARAKLSAAGERSDLIDWHRRWYRQFVQDAIPHLTSADQLVWLGRLERDHDNLRAMLERAYDSGEMGIAVEMAADLAWFWFLHSHYNEGETWLDRLIDHLDATHPAVRARLLIGSARLMRRDTGKTSREHLVEALRYAEEVGSAELAGWAWAYMCLLDIMEKEFEDGSEHAERALDEFQEAQSMGGVGFALWMKAASAGLRSRFETGAIDDESAALVASLVDPAKAVGDRNFLGHIGYSLGIYLMDVGELDKAAVELGYATRALAELGNKACSAHNMDQIARLQTARGRAGEACTVLASTQAIRDRLGFPGHPVEAELWSEAITEARDALEAAEFETAWAQGYQMSFRQATDYALALL